MTEKAKGAGSRDGYPADDLTASKREILAVLAGKAHGLANFGPTAIKYPTLRKILLSAALELPADTRLPGIRDLSQCLGSSLVTIQKAVTELINEGVLYSKPRAGVFVRNRETGQPSQKKVEGTYAQGPGHPFHSGFSFGTDSGLPFQQKFWVDMAERFRKSHPNSSPTLHFDHDPSRHNPPLDVYEGSNWTSRERGYPANLNEVVNIGRLASGGMLPISASREGQLPLYYRTYFLFYNQELLDSCGVRPPEYRTFSAQSEYLTQVAPELSKNKFEAKPYSIQEPVTLLGKYITEYLKLFDGEDKNPSLGDDLLDAVENLIRFAQKCQYEPYARLSPAVARRDFIGGKIPLYLGYSFDYWEFSQSKLPFTLAAYPVWCCDDSFFLWPRVGSISRHSENPVESLNFLTFLLRAENQARFIATGAFGADLTQKELPKMAIEFASMSDVLRKSTPFHLHKKHYYLAVNVLGGQIWRSLLEDVHAPEVLKKSIQMGHFYLNHVRQNIRPSDGTETYPAPAA